MTIYAASQKRMWMLWLLGALLIVAGQALSDALATGVTLIDTVGNLGQLALVLFIWPALIIVTPPAQRVRLARTFALGIAAVILVGLVTLMALPGTYATLVRRGVFIGGDVLGESRFGSFMGANGLAKTVAATVPLLFAVYLHRHVSRLHLGVAGVLGTTAIVLASSWGGAAAFVIAVAMVSVWVLRRAILERRWHIPLAIVALLSTVMALMHSAPTEMSDARAVAMFERRILQVLQHGDLSDAGSFTVKRDLTVEAWTQIERSPFLGIGSGRYAASHSTYGQNVHNSLLLLWVEGGIAAAMGLLVLCASGAAYLLRHRGASSQMALLAAVSLLVFVLNSLSNTSITPRFIVLPYLLVVALPGVAILPRVAWRHTWHASP